MSTIVALRDELIDGKQEAHSRASALRLMLLLLNVRV